MPATGNTTARGYGWRYQRERARLLAADPPCWRCGRPATTIDHVPPLATHLHEHGTDCCELLPACAPCNLGAGAQLGNIRRRQPRWLASSSMGETREPGEGGGSMTHPSARGRVFWTPPRP